LTFIAVCFKDKIICNIFIGCCNSVSYVNSGYFCFPGRQLHHGHSGPEEEIRRSREVPVRSAQEIRRVRHWGNLYLSKTCHVSTDVKQLKNVKDIANSQNLFFPLKNLLLVLFASRHSLSGKGRQLATERLGVKTYSVQ